MTDPLEHLENELRNLRPVKLSPAMMNAVEKRLAKNSSVLRWCITGGLATAASLLAVILLRPVPPETGSIQADPIPNRSGIMATDGPPPTLFAYNRAARRSPDELNGLLDRHASELLAPENPVSFRDLMDHESQVK